MQTETLKYLLDLNNDGLFNHAYSDISAYVLRSSWSAGRSGPPPEYDVAGSCSLSLDNSTSIFSTFNESSPIHNLLVPDIGIRITSKIGSGAEVTMFQGFLQDFDPVVGLPVGISTAEFSGYGILAKLATGDISIALQENITTGDAVKAILDAAGFDSGDYSIDSPTLTTLSKWWLKKDTNPLAAMREIQDSELGRIREGRDGKIYFEGRDHTFNPPHMTSPDIPQATYGTGVLNIWNLRQINSRANVHNFAQCQVRTFNESESMILITLADVPNKQGGTPLIIPAATGSPAIPGALTVEVEYPNDSAPGNHIGVKTWGMVDYEANSSADDTGDDISENVAQTKTELGRKLKIDFLNYNYEDAHLVVLRIHGTAIVEGDPSIIKSGEEGKDKKEYPQASIWITDAADAKVYLDYLVLIDTPLRPRFAFDVMANYNDVHLSEAQERQTGDRIRIAAGAPYGIFVNAEFIIDKIGHQVDELKQHTMTITCTKAPASQLSAFGSAKPANIISNAPPEDIWISGWISAGRLLFAAMARRYTAGITGCELRLKLIPPGESVISVDMRTVAEGGTFADNGATQLIITPAAGWQGAHYQLFYGANLGRWYQAWRFINSAGWSLWNDGNPNPSLITDYIDTEGNNFSDTGPPADWTVNIQPGPQTGTAIVVTSRPATNGKRILFAFFQIKDSTTGSWRDIDANAGAAITRYDGSAIDHTYDPSMGKITKATGDYGDAATYGGLLLIERRQSLFDSKYCIQMALDPSQVNGSEISGIIGGDPAFSPDVDGKYTLLRIKIVKPAWEWDSEGYFAQAGYNAGPVELWDNPSRGDLTSQTFKSNPFILPAGVDLEDLQARVWFGSDYSFSDGGIYSPCPLAPPSIITDPGVIVIKCSVTITIDCGLGSIFYVDLDQNAVLANFVNPKHGRPVILIIRQNGAGGHTFTITGSKFTYGNEITAAIAVISSTALSRNYFGFIHDGDRDKTDIVSFVSTYV